MSGCRALSLQKYQLPLACTWVLLPTSSELAPLPFPAVAVELFDIELQAEPDLILPICGTGMGGSA